MAGGGGGAWACVGQAWGTTDAGSLPFVVREPPEGGKSESTCTRMISLPA
jgi:hypothetical protein